MIDRGRWLSLFGAAGLVLACALEPSRPTLADDPSSSDDKPGKVAKPNAPTKAERNSAGGKAAATATKISPDREAAAIAFAEENHPELATLLSSLKQNNPTEFRAAVAELDRIVERLAAMKQKNPQQHDSELTHWKMNSRIRLLAARLTMSDNPAIEAELKTAVREKVELTLAERKAERERLQKRVEKLDQTISELSTKLDEVAEKELANVKKSAQSSRPTAKTKPGKKGEEHAAAKPVERSANNKDKSGDKSPVKESKSK